MCIITQFMDYGHVIEGTFQLQRSGPNVIKLNMITIA